ncbi:MAG: hypothetical protein CVU65_05155 [Deltaproteobacteria bacterium HGW-Deltaproteobacteria-22]|jgi:hypothetical protein|nr:MAG: hypothetical protein CVU65_05155 [Deltaproteobacteria bacterium HGW-Deltaproteobacteria-22]
MKALKYVGFSLALLVPLSASFEVWASDCKPDVMTRLKRMHKSAMEDLDQMEFASAKKTLEDSISMARRELCDETLEYANILVDLGIMYITDPDSPDESRGRLRFKSALKVNPCAKINPDLANPKLIKMLDDERTKAGVTCKDGAGPKDPGPKDPGPKDPGPKDPGPKDPPADEEDTGPEPQRIEHEVPDEAPALTALTLKCRAPKAGGVGKLVIYYRKSGETDYTAAEMANFSGFSWKVTIPRDDIKGTVFQYYIAALGDNNKPVMANGNSGAPNIISLTKATGNNPSDEECDPLNPSSCKKTGPGPGPDPGPKTPSDIKWHLNLGGRWGAGYLSTSMCSFMAPPTDASICDGKGVHIQTPGFAFGEMGGELGLHYFMTDSVSLGLDAKAGFVTTDYAEDGSPYGVGFSGLGKVRWFPTGRKELFRPYMGGVLGGGLMWHSWQVDENLGKTDIFQHGFIMAGATFGFQVGSPTAAFYINIDAIGIFPQQATFHLDISAGLVLAF